MEYSISYIELIFQENKYSLLAPVLRQNLNEHKMSTANKVKDNELYFYVYKDSAVTFQDLFDFALKRLLSTRSRDSQSLKKTWHFYALYIRSDLILKGK